MFTNCKYSGKSFNDVWKSDPLYIERYYSRSFGSINEQNHKLICDNLDKFKIDTDRIRRISKVTEIVKEIWMSKECRELYDEIYKNLKIIKFQEPLIEHNNKIDIKVFGTIIDNVFHSKFNNRRADIYGAIEKYNKMNRTRYYPDIKYLNSINFEKIYKYVDDNYKDIRTFPERHLNFEHIKGEADIILENEIIDIKTHINGIGPKITEYLQILFYYVLINFDKKWVNKTNIKKVSLISPIVGKKYEIIITDEINNALKKIFYRVFFSTKYLKTFQQLVKVYENDKSEENYSNVKNFISKYLPICTNENKGMDYLSFVRYSQIMAFNEFLSEHENDLIRKRDEAILSEMEDLVNKLEEKRLQLSKNVSEKDIECLFYQKYIISEVLEFNDAAKELLEEEYKVLNNEITLTEFIDGLYDGMYCIHEDKDSFGGYYMIYYAFKSKNMEKIYAKKLLYYLNICKNKNKLWFNEIEIRKNIKEWFDLY